MHHDIVTPMKGISGSLAFLYKLYTSLTADSDLKFTGLYKTHKVGEETLQGGRWARLASCNEPKACHTVQHQPELSADYFDYPDSAVPLHNLTSFWPLQFSGNVIRSIDDNMNH